MIYVIARPVGDEHWEYLERWRFESSFNEDYTKLIHDDWYKWTSNIYKAHHWQNKVTEWIQRAREKKWRV